jgi:hypothetical protein
MNRALFLIIQKSSTDSNLKWFKRCLPSFEQFQIKCGFEERNNFPYRGFLRVEVDFEFKFEEAPRISK